MENSNKQSQHNTSPRSTADPSSTTTADERRCNQCGNTQPLSEFRNQQRPSFETKNCLTCRKKNNTQKRKRYEERTRNNTDPGRAVCPHCTQLRPEADFQSPTGRYQRCRTCRTLSNKRRESTKEEGEEQEKRPATEHHAPNESAPATTGTIATGDGDPVTGTIASPEDPPVTPEVETSKPRPQQKEPDEDGDERCSDCGKPFPRSVKAKFDEMRSKAQDRVCFACVSAAASSPSAPVATTDVGGAPTESAYQSSPKRNTGSAQKARAAGANEETRGGDAEGETNGAVDDPLARLEPSVASSANQGGEAPEETTPATTATPLVGNTTPIDLRDDLFLFSPPIKPLPQWQVPPTPTPTTTTTTTTATSPDGNAATATIPTTPAEVATSLSKSAPWNAPYNPSMPISRDMFTASRAYLLGLQTADQLTRAHGKSVFRAVQSSAIDFVGLAMPSLQPLLGDLKACALLHEALLFQLHRPGLLAPDHVRFLERLWKHQTAFVDLWRDAGVTSRFVQGLERHIRHLSMKKSMQVVLENELQMKVTRRLVEEDGGAEELKTRTRKKGDDMMKLGNVDSEGDVEMAD